MSKFKIGDQVRFINPYPNSSNWWIWKANTEFHILIGTSHKITRLSSSSTSQILGDWYLLDPGLPGKQFNDQWLERVPLEECQCPNLLNGHLKKCRYPKTKR